jgi:hypothetical protein
MPRTTGKPRRHSCTVKIRAVSTHSASGGQWHPTGSVKCQTGTWEAASRSHTGEKAYANPQAGGGRDLPQSKGPRQYEGYAHRGTVIIDDRGIK